MTFESEYKPAHLVQSLAQASVYFYVALFWDGIREQAPYILLQLVFAHLFYFALTYWRERKIRYGLSMFPIVLSINLFIWFYPRYFIFHLLMVAAAILAKTYLVRERNGRIGHIFNPSGLVMAAAAVLVILGNWDYAIRTNELLSAYVRTPHILLWVFAAGCFSQWAGKVQPVAMGAYIALIFSMILADGIVGSAFQHHWVHPSVFIGITLLITDPVTSPKNKWPQFVFGMAYGLSVVPLVYLLTVTGNKGFYDKILFVPVLNYLAPYFEKLTLGERPALPRWTLSFAYALFFLVSYPVVQTQTHRVSYLKNNVRK
jgi:hypothetical protein